MTFFSIWFFIHEHSQFTGQQGKGKTISLMIDNVMVGYLFKLCGDILETSIIDKKLQM